MPRPKSINRIIEQTHADLRHYLFDDVPGIRQGFGRYTDLTHHYGVSMGAIRSMILLHKGMTLQLICRMTAHAKGHYLVPTTPLTKHLLRQTTFSSLSSVNDYVASVIKCLMKTSNMTIEDVCARSGLGSSTVYRLFRTPQIVYVTTVIKLFYTFDEPVTWTLVKITKTVKAKPKSSRTKLSHNVISFKPMDRKTA